MSYNLEQPNCNKKMNLSEFDYKLPKELIATEPSEKRNQARLLVMDKVFGRLTDDYFYNLSKHLKEGDVLVFNDSRVLPARLCGEMNGRKFEILLVKKLQTEAWECWVKPGRKAVIGEIYKISEKLNGQLIERKNDIFIFDFNLKNNDFFREVERVGKMPIPPYILKAREKSGEPKYEKTDMENYQTVFAKNTGSVAAPTAGLHFDDQILAQLNKNGIQIEKVTLHVSLGTFQPITSKKIEDFEIHSEYFEINSETAERLNQAKDNNRRIIAVGTTSVRVLESCVEPKANGQKLIAKSGETNIYIYPGYKFKFIDGMITNFHLPKSSLLLLVSAFAGHKNILEAYEHAIKEKYHFYSYGDGMLIL